LRVLFLVAILVFLCLRRGEEAGEGWPLERLLALSLPLAFLVLDAGEESLR